MSQPKSITTRVGSLAMRVEYVKTRGVLRFRATSTGSPEETRADGRDDNVSAAAPMPGRAARRREEIELTLSEFRSALDIEDRDLAAPMVYLLFAGRRLVPAAGTGDLMGTWASETEARAAFRRCREDPAWLWAELARVEPGRSSERVAWFGTDRQEVRGELRAVHAPAGTETPGRFRRLLRSSRTSA